MSLQNELYLAVLPQISLSAGSVGKTEQILTLLPDRNFATEFFPDQVDDFIQVFEKGQESLTGGHVEKYVCEKEATTDQRVVVKVSQRVRR